MNWKYKIVDIVLFIVFWIMFYVNIIFSRELGLPTTGKGLTIFIFDIIGICAIYLLLHIIINRILDKF